MSMGNRNLASVYGEYDAVVSGGGLIGLACAVRLARSGRKVALVERRSTLGWEIVRARRMAGPFWLARLPDCSPVVKELLAGAISEAWSEHGFNAPMAELIFDQWVVEAGIDVLFHGWSVEVVGNNGRTEGLIVGTREGYQLLAAPLIVETDDAGRLIDTSYVKSQVEEPVQRSFFAAAAPLDSPLELELPAGRKVSIRTAGGNRSRVDVGLIGTDNESREREFHAAIVDTMQAIRESTDGWAEAKTYYLAEEEWKEPGFLLRDGFPLGGSEEEIGQLIGPAPIRPTAAQSTAAPCITTAHFSQSRMNGAILAGPWLPVYREASCGSEENAIINRLLLGEAAAVASISTCTPTSHYKGASV